MPYIPKKDREKYTNLILTLKNITEISNKGELEFLVYLVMKKFMSTRENRYSNLHDAVYGTIHAGEEFKRRYLDNRENDARKSNGDIDEI